MSYLVKMIRRLVSGQKEVVCQWCGKVVINSTENVYIDLPYCSNCGKYVADAGHDYCGFCGVALTQYKGAESLGDR